jgi:hypothetical protein
MYLYFNSNSVDDWMVPFFALVAVLWFTMALIVQNWNFLKLFLRGRIRVRNGECFSPNGHRLFADDDGTCVICAEPMQGQEVRTNASQQPPDYITLKLFPHFSGCKIYTPASQRHITALQVTVLPCRHIFHSECCARWATENSRNAPAGQINCPACRCQTNSSAFRQFLFE